MRFYTCKLRLEFFILSFLLTHEFGFGTQHGVDYEVWKAATEIEQNGAQWISDGAYAFMFESSRAFTLTDYAVNRSGTIHYHEPKM